MLAELSGSAATLFGVIIGLLVTLVGAVWRIGTKMGMIGATLNDHSNRISRIESHEDQHDEWHRRRGIV